MILTPVADRQWCNIISLTFVRRLGKSHIGTTTSTLQRRLMLDVSWTAWQHTWGFAHLVNRRHRSEAKSQAWRSAVLDAAAAGNPLLVAVLQSSPAPEDSQRIQTDSVLFSSAYSSTDKKRRRRLLLSTYSTVKICWRYSTLHQSLIPNRDIGRKSRFLPQLGCLSECCSKVWYEKTRTVWLSDGEKVWEYVYFFQHNKLTWMWQIPGKTPHDGIGPNKKSAYATNSGLKKIDFIYYTMTAKWRSELRHDNFNRSFSAHQRNQQADRHTYVRITCFAAAACAR